MPWSSGCTVPSTFPVPFIFKPGHKATRVGIGRRTGQGSYIGKSIPKEKWFPFVFDLAQASFIDTVSGSFFNTFNNASDNLRKLGIQVGGPSGVTWQGKFTLKFFTRQSSSICAAPADNNASLGYREF